MSVKNIILAMIALLAAEAISQNRYRAELETLLCIDKLPAYENAEMAQVSSFDPSGGNDDGFSGKHSYIRREQGELVIAELKGPGVINRIWTPTPSTDSIRFYFDGEKTPRINLPFIELFSGKTPPFTLPLCGNEIGGYYCYLPISYSKSLKITYKGNGLKFHQIQYKTFPEKEKIETYSPQLLLRNKSLTDSISRMWKGKLKPFEFKNTISVQKKSITITLSPGESKPIFGLNTGGRILGIEIQPGDKLKGMYRDLILSAKWDNETSAAIEAPLSDFFGYAFGNPAMSSLIQGEKNGLCYSYIPMPFDQSANIDLCYTPREDKIQENVALTATVYFTEQARDSLTEGKFYTQWRREISPENGKPYTIAHIRGKGHYIGTILAAQGLNSGMTLFWEGDDISEIDGEIKLHGTGSEDYFNGGWYAVTDRWDRGINLPLHGALGYDLKTGRTGGFRWFLSDKQSFRNSYRLTIEHGPEKNDIDVDYTSIACFYSDKPIFSNTEMNERNRTMSLLPKFMIMAQDFTTRLYWSSSMTMCDGYIHLISKPSDNWMTNIDFEAVPMVQINLQGVDHGLYNLSVVYEPQPSGSPFSVWQRTQPIGEWIQTDVSDNNQTTTAFVGKIEINRQQNTITLRRKKEKKTEIKIHSFILERINDNQ